MIGKVTGYWNRVQRCLFPELEAYPDLEVEPTDKLRDVIRVLDVLQVENFVVPSLVGPRIGRPTKGRPQLLRAFVAKAVLNLETTRALIDRLKVDIVLRRICGWERKCHLPCEATFSNAFAEFAVCGIGGAIHAALIRAHCGDHVAHNISRDATAINGREKPSPKPVKAPEQKRKRGRPKKGTKAEKRLKRIARQKSMTLSEMIADLPAACDVGAKKNAKGHTETWIGYKLHVDVADGGVPISAILTSASVHDSQVAIPLETLTAQRVPSLYSLMDKAYGAQDIQSFIVDMGKIPVVPEKKVNGVVPPPMDPVKAERFKARSGSERFNSDLKDNHGGNTVRVRGDLKVGFHLMLGVLVVAAKALLRPI